jgi:tetratricopeptide (TPR) repeat protein
VSALVRQAAFWRERGRKDLAGQSLQRALAADPNNPDALAAMARYAREDGDIAGAERWAAACDRWRPTIPGFASPRLRPAAPPSPSARTRRAPAPPPPPPRPARRRPPPVDRGALCGPRASRRSRRASWTPPRATSKPPSDPPGRPGRAGRPWRRAPAPGAVRRGRAAAGQGQRRVAQSRARWREALASARFYGGLRAAQAALAAGDAAKAERLVAPLTAGSGRDVALAQQLLGDALARQGRLAEAEAAYRQAARNAPGSPDIQTGLVEALVAQGKIAEAEALAAKTPGGGRPRSRPGRGSPRPRPTSCGRRAT